MYRENENQIVIASGIDIHSSSAATDGDTSQLAPSRRRGADGDAGLPTAVVWLKERCK
ncbi:hypothetical protein L665_01198 [Ralstonia solanacearum SD54]|nr:hypothetical protein A3768_1415 [Ralstonia solanacearum]ESS50125.1 hypothetical protein L665_01198 [Ralstonia solanacearum SD54]